MKDSYIYYTDKLDKEYLAVFEQVELYVLSQNVDDNTREERLGELLDMFLSASETGKPVQKITGNDLEHFCKTFCSDFGIKNFVISILDWFKSIAKVLILISVLDLLFPESDAASGGNVWNGISSLNVSAYFVGIIVAGLLSEVVNIVTRRMMFRKKQVSMKFLRAASLAAAVLGFVIIIAFLNMDIVELFPCPVWVMLTFSCAYLCIYHLLYGRHVKREKVKFFDLVQEESRKEFPGEMEKKFEKARRKSLKKGRGELTMEAFLAKEEKECNRMEKLKYFYYILPLVMTACVCLGTWKTDGFDGFADGVIYVAINLVVQYVIMLGMWKIVSVGEKERREWISEKKEERKRGTESVEE